MPTLRRYKKAIIGGLALLVGVVFVVFLFFREPTRLVSIQDFNALLRSEKIQSIKIDSRYIYLKTRFKVYKTARLGWTDSMQFPTNIPIEVLSEDNTTQQLLDMVIIFFFLVLLAVILRLAWSKKALLQPSIDAAQARPSTPQPPLRATLPSVRFKDVAGTKEVKEELYEIVDYLKNPKKYQDLKIKLPKGVLLVGPPGVGKTMIAKALAAEAKVPFFYHSGSAFVQIYVGVGAKRVRELFAKAKAFSPSIVFIDEIDAVGKARGHQRNDERETTLNQLLTEMDGFEESSQVIVIGATNKIDVMDEALLRSGRFDRRIFISLPDLEERIQILESYLQDKQHNLDCLEVAKICVGFSGAMLSSLVNESALNALRRNAAQISMKDILEVKDKIAFGKKKNVTLSEQEKNLYALYQSAKALSAYWLEVEFDKVLLVGEFLVASDRRILSKSEMNNSIKVHLSGMIVLDLFFKESYTLAKDDLKHALETAKKMCEEYGMGHKFIGDRSDVEALLSALYTEQREFLGNFKAQVQAMAQALLDKEKLSKTQIQEILRSFV
ncbi:ATP-dependent metallopeptidase FtsH/Yme1/Tma family protein [Helicobacter heilmannii]|uniref:ATP-dependent metallopeptidase FtsH/Yme1/Tma family protein n=1 Tax=Helicobacter heilmannii TaxID=35817 RepID=UPI0025522A97|nr:ATP-dependent metallopeptidase FtsH/Yme1/Tma family protein [Helicobacter heilmannii]